MKNKNIIGILGLGLSGKATLRAVQARGYDAMIWDDGADALVDYPDVPRLDAASLPQCDALITAPGIGDGHPLIQMAHENGIEILCDIELWHRWYPQAQTIGITGTNGKSTLTAMVHHVLTCAGHAAHMGGNIGTAIFDLPDPSHNADAIYVLELSSFQIERCPEFRPDVTALLNVTPDHLDRHGTMDRYAAIKATLLEGTGRAIIATDDIWTQQIAQMVAAAKMRDLTRVHNSPTPRDQNQRMAIEIVQGYGIDADQARHALQNFSPLPHRQNIIVTIGDISFVDDSKATNAEAVRSALQNFNDIIWIVGGAAKDGGLNAVGDDLSHVRHACVIGADTKPFMDWLRDNNVPCSDCGVMAAAVAEAVKQADRLRAKTVLLSPACASYDQYSNFMQRGQDFIQCVKTVIDQA